VFWNLRTWVDDELASKLPADTARFVLPRPPRRREASPPVEPTTPTCIRVGSASAAIVTALLYIMCIIGVRLPESGQHPVSCCLFCWRRRNQSAPIVSQASRWCFIRR
jgi:hypothetical protein